MSSTGVKTCSRGHEYTKRNGKWKGCDTCKKASDKRYAKRNADRIRNYNREWQASYRGTDQWRDNMLRRDYGISLEEYQALLEAQDHSCAICGKHQDTEQRKLAVDHNHETGKVRGLLCGNCNMGIGLLGDTPAGLKLAYEYLDRTNK